MNKVKDRYHAYQERNAWAYSTWLPGWRNRRHRRPTALAWLVCTAGLLALSPFAGAPALGFTIWMGLFAVTTLLQMMNKALTNNIGERSARCWTNANSRCAAGAATLGSSWPSGAW